VIISAVGLLHKQPPIDWPHDGRSPRPQNPRTPSRASEKRLEILALHRSRPWTGFYPTPSRPRWCILSRTTIFISWFTTSARKKLCRSWRWHPKSSGTTWWTSRAGPDRIENNSVTRWLNLLLEADPKRFIQWFLKDRLSFVEFYLFHNIEVRVREHDKTPPSSAKAFSPWTRSIMCGS